MNDNEKNIDDLEKFYEQRQNDLEMSKKKQQTKSRLKHHSPATPSKQLLQEVKIESIIPYENYSKESFPNRQTTINNSKQNTSKKTSEQKSNYKNKGKTNNKDLFRRRSTSIKHISETIPHFNLCSIINNSSKPQQENRNIQFLSEQNDTNINTFLKQYNNQSLWTYRPLSYNKTPLSPELTHSKITFSLISLTNPSIEKPNDSTTKRLNTSKSTKSFVNQTNYSNVDIQKIYSQRMNVLRQYEYTNVLLQPQSVSQSENNCSERKSLSKNNREKKIKQSFQSKRDFYKEGMQWKLNKENDLQRQRSIQEKNIFDQLPFQPNKHKYNEVLDSIKNHPSDYIYNKNKEWLQNKEKRKIHKQQELNDKIIKLSNNYNKRNPSLSKGNIVENVNDNLSKPKYFNLKRSQSVRNARKGISDWLKCNIDNDLYYVNYNKIIPSSKLNNNDSNNKNFVFQTKEIEKDIYSDNYKKVFTMSKEVKELKSMLNNLKKTLQENKTISK